MNKDFINKIIIFLLSLTSMSFVMFEKSEKEKLFNKLQSKIIKEIERKLCVPTVGRGGSLPNKIKSFDFRFAYSEPQKLHQARRQIKEIVEEALNQINNDEEIRYYLFEYPFTSKSVEVGIFYIDDRTGNYFPPPYLATLGLANGRIFYEEVKPKDLQINDFDTCKIIHRETYEEALKHIEEE